MTNPAESAGPNRDGSKSLASESKVGIVVTFVLSTLGVGILGWLTNLDTSTWTGWWGAAATGAVASAIGLVSAYLKRNR
jgi:hypothetical protein